MDGLSISVTVIAVVQTVGTVISLGYQYISSVKQAPKDVRELLGELGSLDGVLDTLQDYIMANPQSLALEKLNVPDGPLSGCLKELNGLHSRLKGTKLADPKSAKDGTTILERFKWPLKDKETAQVIQRLERYKSLFMFSLTADHISLSKKIEAYVSNTDVAVQVIQSGIQYTTLAVDEIKRDVQHTSITALGIQADLKSTNSIVQRIKRNLLDANSALQDLQSDSAAQRAWRGREDTIQDAERRRDILNWLCPDDSEKRHLEISESRQKNTGEWLLKSPEFRAWRKKSPNSRLLWGHGIPGAGKTFLCSAVIDHLQDLALQAPKDYGVAYFYFNYTDQGQQKPVNVLASLVRQLASQTTQLPCNVKDLYRQVGLRGKRPTSDKLFSTLISLRSFDQIFLVFDALDECNQEQRKKLLPLFHMMGECGINIFLTSRHHPEDIQYYFRNSPKVELQAHPGDLELYIQQKIEDNPRAKRLITQGECKDKIISELIDCANGMFLLVHFHIEYICQQTTPRKILEELERLKISTTEDGHLDKIYDRAMENIQRQAKPAAVLAKKIFSWLVKAMRTLTVDELQMAVAVELGRYELSNIDLPDRTTLLDVCAGLVTIDEKSNTIRLTHYTIQQYFMKRSIIPDDSLVDFNLAIVCTTFLSLDVFTQGACTSYISLNARYATYPLLRYAAYFLMAHLRSCDEVLSTNPLLKFLSSPGCISSYSQAKPLRSSHLDLLSKDKGGIPEPSPFENWYVKRQSPLHIASTVGHKIVVQLLLEKSANISAIDSREETALHRAAGRGHGAVVRYLLENGSNISAVNHWGETGLHKAAERGAELVIQLLLKMGANVAAKDVCGETALHRAADHGHEAVVRLLLKNGANVLGRDNREETALHKATSRGHERVVRFLLDEGANISATNRWGETALHQAAVNGYEEVVRLLLESGADVSVRNSREETVLHNAAVHGRDAVVRLLLEKGADTSARTGLSSFLVGATALHYAAATGHEAVVRLLLEKGVDPSVQDHSGNTGLHIAAGHGHDAVVQLLLEKGANASSKNGSGNTPLSAATSRRRESNFRDIIWQEKVGAQLSVIVRLLLMHGKDQLWSLPSRGRGPKERRMRSKSECRI